MSVTRSEIAAELVLRFPEVPYETLLEAMFTIERTIAEGLKRREKVKIRGFGRWWMTPPMANPRSVGTNGPTISRGYAVFRLATATRRKLFPRKRK